MLHDSNGLHVRDEAARDCDEAASVKVSARVRDIISRNLATADAGPGAGALASARAAPGVDQLTEENRALQVCLVFVAFDILVM